MANTKDSELLGSDEGYTLDAEEFKQRIQERRKKLLEAEDKGSGGASTKQEQSVEDEYSVGKEGKNKSQ